MLPVIISLIIFLVIGTITFVLMKKQSERERARLVSKIRGERSVGGKQVSERELRDRRRADLAKKLQEGDSGGKKKVTIKHMLVQAGLPITVTQFWIFSVISACLFMGFGLAIRWSPPVILLLAVIGLLGFPRLVLHKLKLRRQKKFLEEFGDALESSVRLLKAGMPVAEAIAMISREFKGPVGEEMAYIYDAQKLGIPLHEACQQSAERMPIPEMRMFATGITIQAQTGASLSEVLSNLASVIRARFRLKRKVKSLASEANASASIIGALPILVGLGIFFLNKEWILLLFTDSLGKILSGGGMIWMLIGIFIMRAMINFKV